MKSFLYLLISTAVLFSATVLAGNAHVEAFAGTWKLNVEKSTYPPGMCPAQMVIVMEAAGEGVTYRSETVYADGSLSRAQYTAEYSGKEAVVTGNSGLLLPVSLKKIDEKTVLASYKRGFQVIATSRRTLSEDGRVMTITTVSSDKTGKAITSIGVYNKVESTRAAR